MTSFHFRFESLLVLQRQQRNELIRELTETHTAINDTQEKIDHLQQQRDELRSAAAGRFATDVHISVDRLRHEARYDRQLADDQDTLGSTRKQLEAELEQRRERLIEAEAEVKRLERLREKQSVAYNQLQLQREQATADERTIARMIHSRR
ncbi:flagellar export protein FliJ [Allorhodopirellula heiligendammensis]|uniref:Flagellar FliJ protein n=1 Tax=Allorhodopirellula heiligendammensis TaxID=2714739 RepID=A0A5C6BWU6_9BACT|nr:flagellar export protein FliJ [Allorhodopirellula heiligendammensis]TWU16398.1 flagellar biosynthesis chaperone [Allorhodopirellula heiligendammensis]